MPKHDPSSPSSLPFKEDMYRLYAKRRRQPRWVRALLAVGAIALIYIIGANLFGTPTWTADTGSKIVAKDKAPTRNAEDLGLNAHSRATAPQLPVLDELDGKTASSSSKRPSKGTGSGSNSAAEKEHDKAAAAKAQVEVARGTTEDATAVPSDYQKIESDLKHIFAITPDELHVRELLRPIENSGKERLREIGLRARAFRTLFEAWEQLHLVHTKESTHIRDDIITYLRNAKDLSGVSKSRTRADIVRSYESFRYFLTKLSALLYPWTAPYFADHMTLHASIKHGGRGIVLSGGDGQLHYMLTSVRSIRKLGCDLPVEVMYLGDDDLGDDARSTLEALPGVITRDMKQMVHDEGWDLRGWAGKPFAMLLSSFREVIFIDADAMFFKSPEILFDDEAYVKTGALFFRDRLMFPESKRKWLQQILPKPLSRKVRQNRFWTGESGHMQESGVLVVDKWRHFDALMLVTRMNGPDRDGNKEKGIIGTYDMVYGDKETFWIGWELIGDSDYAFHSGEAGNMGVAFEKYDAALARVKGEDPESAADDLKDALGKGPDWVKSDADGEESKADENKKESESGEEEAADVATPADSEKQETLGGGSYEEKQAAARIRRRAAVPAKSIDSDSEQTENYGHTNYTICAPQLLHLDRDGRPLWFNGWVLENKFDTDHPRLASFDSFMFETKQGSKVADWRLETNNMCCLISDRIHRFNKQERKVINDLLAIAEDVGALKKKD